MTDETVRKNGWRMKKIDEMDMPGFLRLRAWDATREQEKKTPQRFIYEVKPGVKRERPFSIFHTGQRPASQSSSIRMKVTSA